MPSLPRRGIKRWCCPTSVWRLASDVVAYIGPKSRTERPIKIKIGAEVAHVTCDSDTTFKVKRTKGQGYRGRGGSIMWRPPAQLVYFTTVISFIVNLPIVSVRFHWLSPSCRKVQPRLARPSPRAMMSATLNSDLPLLCWCRRRHYSCTQ